MDDKIKKFIQDNLDLIQEDTKKSWEAIYKNVSANLIGEFTSLLLNSGIDPAKRLGYIPNYYLCESNISHYENPENIAIIGHRAFYSCRNLTSIKNLNNVVEIGIAAFTYTFNLKEITLSNKLQHIGEYAFAFKDSSKDNPFKIKFLGTIQEWKSISKGHGWRANNTLIEIECIDGKLKLR